MNWKTLWQKGKDTVSGYRFLLQPTVILSAVYLFGISAILRANFFYHDDIARVLEGYSRWGFSRYLSNFLSHFLHADTYLTDISPLTQVIAVFLVALASMIAVHLITGERKCTFWHYVSAIPIGLSPYFLECLSFKYDSPYMALSVLFSVVPLLFCDGSILAYILSIVLGMFGMCMSYQASAGIFPMLVVVMGIVRWVRGEKTLSVLKFYGISAAGFLLAMLLFRKLLMTEFIAYASTTMASATDLIPSAIYNYKRYIVHFLQGFKPEWLAVSFLICVCFLWTAVAVSRQNKIATFFVTGLAMIILFALSFGVYPFLTDPLFYPRAMYGIGCFIAFQGIFAATERPRAYLSRLACLVLSWYFFVFSFTYGNALGVQAQYTDFRITEVIDDLAECETLYNEDVTLQITGSIGYSPVLENMRKEFPMIEKLVPVNFQGDGWWGEYGFRYYYKLPVELKFADTYDPPEEVLPLVADNYYHTIRADEDYIWVDLH